MNRQDVIKQFEGIRTWTRGGERAPHKPLLLLMALGRISRAEGPELTYRDVDRGLRRLLMDFGPRRKSYHPEYPFWRLQNDGIWLVRDADRMQTRKGNTDVPRGELLRHETSGCFTPGIRAALQADPGLVEEIAGLILEGNFATSLHEDILAAVGLSLGTRWSHRSKRDPAFREKVLRAYEHRCAVCGFDLRLGSSDLALEAAHIMWHQAGGPDIESNGLALCSIHHKMLDRGAFTVAGDHRVLVSQEVFGSSGMEEHLLRHHGNGIRAPQSQEYIADPKYLDWHGREVFRGPGRAV
jgi:putative restriction endonuclease